MHHPHDSWPTARQTCRNHHTSTMYRHSKPTTGYPPSQTSSQSLLEQRGTPTIRTAQDTHRILMSSPQCHHRASRPHNLHSRPQHQDPENTSPPRRLFNNYPGVARIFCPVWSITVVTNPQHPPRQCPRMDRQHMHPGLICTEVAALGDAAATNTNKTTVPRRSVANNHASVPLAPAVTHQKLN